MRRIVPILFFVCGLCVAQAQRYVEVGGFIGFANYQGDLAEDPIEFGETRYSFGGFAKYHYSRKLHLRAQLYYGRISGNDANKVENGPFPRNWSFTADIYEASIQAEFLPFARPRIDRVGLFHPQINPFLSLGIGSSFATKTLSRDNTSWREGLREDNPPGDYATSFKEPGDQDNFLVIPIGGGLRFDFTQWTTLAGEFGWRYTRSDYVDGVSVNGNPDKPDWYFFVGVTLSTYFGEQEDYGL